MATLLWHGAISATVVALFSGSVSLLVWRARVAEIDIALRAEAEQLALAVQPAVGDTFDLTISPELQARGPASYYAIWADNGTLIDRSDASREIPLPLAPLVRTRDGQREVVVEAPGRAVVLVGRDLDEPWREIWSLTVMLLVVGGAVLALSVTSGWFLVGSALAPIARINRTARRMIEGDLAARIPVAQVETELGQVAHALNDAFDRLRSSITRQKRFTADASHELRTPLATLSTEAQWALARERTPDAYRESLEVCLRAATRMQATVERLLSLARADERAAPAEAADVDLDALLRSVVEELRPLADSRGIVTDYTGTRTVVRGRLEELREAVTNVLVNAIRYNVEGGRITIAVGGDGRQATVTVIDTGVGIDPKDLPFIFDPFFRADSSRSHDAGGAGLGLAVTRAAIERHGGSVDCTSEVGRGTTSIIRLPQRAES